MAKKLGPYRRKRNFRKTPEPSGKVGKGSGPLTFIVHLHDATRLHYDLRLELDGVLKSWAVPKGPSLNPTEQRLAVQVEDHPLDYGNFEGVIPEGNYGAGPVIVWDRGTYQERSSKSRAESEEAIRKGLAKGHITLLMDGEKLKGEFALVRLPDARNWLLIKKGDAYSSYKKVDWDPRSVVSGKVLGNLKRAESQALRMRPGRTTLPRARVMVPVAKREIPTGNQWIWQEFGLGERALVEVENGQTKIFSRGRIALHRKHPSLTAKSGKLGTAILDGEIVTDPESFRVLDLLYWEGKDLRHLPLKSRLKKLASLRLPKEFSLARHLKGPTDDGLWIARDKTSAYLSGLSPKWVRGKAARSSRVFLTNPSKKLWPSEGYTKKDLVDYYRSVAEAILPHLRDRPLSLHRFPNGITSPGFFQKDLSGYLPSSVQTFAHFSASSGRTIHYALCQDESTLLYLANLACIELNPWMSRVDATDSPDYCVVDLDPDDNPFEEVVRVALAYKKILDGMKLKSFCKTSGATGLHLYIPWKGSVSFEESRAFALQISEQVLEKFPKLTSLERSPTKRRRKIYLDCFQNSRGQTIVAPYSVRPVPGAQVSTPLDWKELKSGIHPSNFTVQTVPARLKKKGDLWENLLKSGNRLPKHLKTIK